MPSLPSPSPQGGPYFYWSILATRWTTLGVGDEQGGLACCYSWGRRVGHDWATELNWTDSCILGLSIGSWRVGHDLVTKQWTIIACWPWDLPLVFFLPWKLLPIYQGQVHMSSCLQSSSLKAQRLCLSTDALAHIRLYCTLFPLFPRHMVSPQ